MAVFTYSRIPAFNPNTSPTSVAKSATGQVYDIGDTGFLTPLNLTLVVGNVATTTLISDANGMFPDFTLLDRTSVVFKSGSIKFVLTTSDPVPGPKGDPGPNTVPTEAAILAEVTTPGTPTYAAQNATYATRKPAAYDSFTGKANATLTAATKLDSGQTYSVRQNIAGVGYVILNGALTHSTGTTTATAAAYAGLDIGERVGRIWAKFTLPDGSAWETLVLIVSTAAFTTPPDFANSASHFVIGSTGYSYEVLTASPFATTVIKAGTFDSPLVTGVEYQVAVDFDGDTATISLPAPVNGYSTAVAQDSRIDTYRGQFATIEHYSHTGNANTRIDVPDWGADGVTSVDVSTAQASRADIKKAIDSIPASGVLPAAPSRVSWAANPAVSVELSTTPAALNATNLTLSVKFPPSGKVKWSAQFWLWMNTGGAAGATGYFGVMEGVTFKAGRKAVSATDVERLYQISGVLTDTPGVTRTYEFAGYASAAAKINFLAENAAGVPADFELTPLES